MIAYSPIIYKSNAYLVAMVLALFIFSGLFPLLGIFLFILFITVFSISRNFLILSFIWIVLFQNAFIAYSANFIDNNNLFKLLHGVSLIIIILYTFIFILSKPLIKREEKPILIFIVAILGICFLYFIIGFYRFGLVSSSVYLRLFITPVLMFVVGLFLSRGGSHSLFLQSFKIFFFIVLGGTILQYFLPSLFTFISNDISYYRLKIDPNINSSQDVINYLNANTYLNLPWDVRSIRAVGFLKSFISGSYFLVIASILLFWYTSKTKTILIFSIVAIALASKGALLAIFFFFLWYFMKRKLNFSTGIVMMVHLGIIVILIFAGLRTKNEHVIGFVSGTEYISGIGNGLGFSGNLSTYQSEIDRELNITSYLNRFKNGSESVYGVLFSSMGIFSLVYILFLYLIVQIIYKRFIDSEYYYLSYLAIIISLQGIFQEEIFSQYALGVVFLFAGFMFKNIKRDVNLPAIY